MEFRLGIKQKPVIGLFLASIVLILLQSLESGTSELHTCSNNGTSFPNNESSLECLCPDNTTGSFCENINCSLFECYNNGTVVNKDEFCECICPFRFFGLLCENERLPSIWPDGPYALLMPVSGCPESTNHGWGAGFIHFTTKHEMEIWREFNDSNGDVNRSRLAETASTLAGPFKNYSFRLNFCFKHANSWVINDTMWPEINITVFGDSEGCPPGFDENNNSLPLPQLDSFWYDGYLPYFEIRNDDNESLLITKHCVFTESVFSKISPVTSKSRFIVVKTTVDRCPSVKKGFDVEEETFHFESVIGIGDTLQTTNLSFCIFTAKKVDDLQPSSWPNGPYALPMLNTGCPEPLDHGWKIGYLSFYNGYYGFYDTAPVDECNAFQMLSNIVEQYSPEYKRFYFCYKYGQQEHDNEVQWPRGNYSIFGTDNGCPEGFIEINMTFTGKYDFHSKKEPVPFVVVDTNKVDYGADRGVRMRLCAKRDEYMEFSSKWKKPFAVLKSSGSSDANCIDKIKGVTLQTTSWDEIPLCIYIPVEAHRTDCGHHEFRCSDGGCIRLVHRCDNERDCVSGEDERNCSNSCHQNQTSSCNKSHVSCDGVDNCTRNANNLEYKKQECFHYEFKCGSGECIKKIHICDNTKDCQDGSDEMFDNCNRRCPRGSFVCHSRGSYKCMIRNWVCDSYGDCRDSIDELDSSCSLACAANELYVGRKEQWGRQMSYCIPVRDDKDPKTRLALDLEAFCQHRNRCTRVKDLCDELVPLKALANGNTQREVFTYQPTISCQRAVGFVDGSIADPRLLASSFEEGHSPQMSRPSKRSWCPLTNDTLPYLEVSLNYVTVIEGLIVYNSIEVGGKTVNKSYIPDVTPVGCGVFTIQYALYKNRFRKYFNQKFEIDESKNISEPQTFTFLQPFLARYVRIYPRKPILNGLMCLKLELLGCPHSGFDQPRISLNKIEEFNLLLSLPRELNNMIFPSDKFYTWNITVPDGGYIRLSFLTINLYNQSGMETEECRYDMITFNSLFEPVSAKHNGLTPIYPTDKSTLLMTFMSCLREKQGNSTFAVRLNKETVPYIWGMIKDSHIMEGKLITVGLLGQFISLEGRQRWFLKSFVYGRPFVLTFTSFNIPCDQEYDLYIKSEAFQDEHLCNTGRRPRHIYKAWTLQINYKYDKSVTRYDPEGFTADFKIEPVPRQHTWFKMNESYEPPDEIENLGIYTVYSDTAKKRYRFSYRAEFEDWVSQAKYCQQFNYSLVVMHTRAELEFLQSWIFYRMSELCTTKKGRTSLNLLSTSAFNWNPNIPIYIHIGLIRYRGIDGLKHIWQDGTSLSFTAWNTGEPRNISSNKCTGMHVNMTTGQGHWVTVACNFMEPDFMFVSVCETTIGDNLPANNGNHSTIGLNGLNSTELHDVRLHRCNSTEWISNLATCDGIPDCFDGSDEDKCNRNNTCSDDMFQCNNGECITIGQVCDNIDDCPDKTDEYCFNTGIRKPKADDSDDNTCFTTSLSTYTSCLDYWKAGYDEDVSIDKSDVYVVCRFNATKHTLLVTTFADVKRKWDSSDIDEERLKLYVADFTPYAPRPDLTDLASDMYKGSTDSFSKCVIKIFAMCPEYNRQSECDSVVVEILFSNNRFADGPFASFIDGTAEHLTIKRRKLDKKKHIKVLPAECRSRQYEIGQIIRCGDGKTVLSSRKCLYDIDKSGTIDGCLNFRHLEDCEQFNCSMGYFKCPSSFCLAKRLVCDGEKQCPGGEDEHNCWCNDRSDTIAVIYNEQIDRNAVPFIHKFARQLYSRQAALYLVPYFYNDSDHSFLFRKTQLHPYSEGLHLDEVDNFTVATGKLYEEISNIFYTSQGISIINIEQYDYVNLKGTFPNSSFIERVYKIIIDSNITKKASVITKGQYTEMTVSNLELLASVGSAVFPSLCQAKPMPTCLNQFRCMSSKVCIPLNQICDDTPQCPFGDDEERCDFQCHPKCRCELYIIDCKSMNITKQDFSNINETVRVLDLSGNTIFENGKLVIPKKFPYLSKLFLKRCGIKSVERETFMNAKNMRQLDLSFNQLKVITSYMFEGLKLLEVLDLTGNRNIESIEPKAFKVFSTLSVLSLTNTRLREIQTDTFWGLTVNILNISHNRIWKMHSRPFNELSATEVYFHDNEIKEFKRGIFDGIDKPKLKLIHASAYKFCCEKPDTLPDDGCYPHQDEFSSCEDLMRNSILQTLAWVVGAAAVVANGCTIFYRLCYDRKSIKQGFSMFVTNLAASDFLMGVYMIIIAVADIIFRDRYAKEDEDWRNSVWCSFAGVLATVSSEASVLFMCLITLDRILAIKYPFGQWKFNSKYSKCAMIVSWAIAFVIALIPILIPDYFEGKFYSTSGVCLALPLTHRRPPGWLYSFLVYVALNFVAFILIALGQLLIYLEIRKTSNRMRKVRSQRRNDVRIAKNLLLVLSTDFLCWFPVGVMAIMAANGYVIPGETYAWTAVLILPVNAALNPFLYTLSAVLQKRADQASSQNNTVGDRIASKDFKVQCNIGVERTTTHDAPTVLRNIPLNKVRPGQISFEPREVLSMYISTSRNMVGLHETNQVYGGFSIEDVLCSSDKQKIRMYSPHPFRSRSKGDRQKDVYEFGRVLEHLLKFTKSSSRLLHVSAETK